MKTFLATPAPSPESVPPMTRSSALDKPNETSAPPGQQEFSRILVPVDFSAASAWILRHTARLAGQNGSMIFLLHVVETGSFMNDLRSGLLTKRDGRSLRDVKTELRRLAERVLPPGNGATLLVKSGRAGPEIIRTARETRSDLIVLTVDNRSAVERASHFLYGSTATWVERHASCPVLMLSLPNGASSLRTGTNAKNATVGRPMLFARTE